MQQLTAVVLKSVLVSGILFGYYLLFLRNRPLNVYNRFYLLCSVALSLIIPFVHFEWYSISAAQISPVQQIFDIVNNTEPETAPAITASSGFTTDNIVWAAYTIISLALLMRAMVGIIVLYKIKATSNVEKTAGVSIIHTELSNAPFSFMNNVYWNDRTDINSREGRQMLKHEMVHITQHHTTDKLFLQLVCALFWINPVYWLMRKELSLVHEFLADGSAIENGDTETFATLLLQSRFGITQHSIVNSFYFSPVKRRLTMLTNTSKTRFSRLRRLSALPLALAAFWLLSCSTRKAAVRIADQKLIVMLDAGHGGQDNGGTNREGAAEKDMALMLTTRLAQLAPEYNIAILQTRSDDNYVTLIKRVEAANNSNAAIYLSVHLNKADASGKPSNGYAVYISEANARYADSKFLATQVGNSLYSIGITPEIVNRKGLVVLQGNNHPAILIECGNIDKPEDMARLKDSQRMDELCRSLLGGVVAYANSKKG